MRPENFFSPTRDIKWQVFLLYMLLYNTSEEQHCKWGITRVLLQSEVISYHLLVTGDGHAPKIGNPCGQTYLKLVFVPRPSPLLIQT
jgi:hypothetical protein